MRKIMRASMLTFALMVTAYAGDMGNPIEQPSSAATTQASTATEVVLNLLQSILALI
jgi:hypothetical protein